jgi:hypothetical protein
VSLSKFGSLDPHRVIQQQGTLVQLGEFRIPCFFGQELCALIEALIATQLDGQVGPIGRAAMPTRFSSALVAEQTRTFSAICIGQYVRQRIKRHSMPPNFYVMAR